MINSAINYRKVVVNRVFSYFTIFESETLFVFAVVMEDLPFVRRMIMGQ